MDKEVDMEELKVKINEILYLMLPGDTTVENMEKIAIAMHASASKEMYRQGIKKSN